MEVQDIIKGIFEVKDKDDLDRVWEALRKRSRQLDDIDGAMIKSTLQIGDKVKFDARSRGMHEGIVSKMNPSRAQVKVQEHDELPPKIWNVPYGMLEKVEGG
jgi:hypothetical protein